MSPEGIKKSYWYKYNLYFFAEHFLGKKLFDRFLGLRSQQLYNKIDESIRTNDRCKTLNIYQVDKDISVKEFKDHTRNAKPLLFKGAAMDWRCTKEWSIDFFEKSYGDEEITLTDNKGMNDPNSSQEFDNMALRDYIKLLRAGSMKYLKFSVLVDQNPELKESLNLEWLRKFRIPGSFREETHLFMGAKGTRTPIHVGFSGNMFMQVTGKKKWVLWEPQERLFLDPRAERIFYFYSDANPYKLDDPSFPLLKHSRKYEITLEPGDVLWVPPFTWHCVDNLTDSIGLAYRFSNVGLAMRSSKMLASLIFLATKPNILTHFLYTVFNKKAYPFTRKQADL